MTALLHNNHGNACGIEHLPDQQLRRADRPAGQHGVDHARAQHVGGVGEHRAARRRRQLQDHGVGAADHRHIARGRARGGRRAHRRGVGRQGQRAGAAGDAVDQAQLGGVGVAGQAVVVVEQLGAGRTGVAVDQQRRIGADLQRTGRYRHRGAVDRDVQRAGCRHEHIAVAERRCDAAGVDDRAVAGRGCDGGVARNRSRQAHAGVGVAGCGVGALLDHRCAVDQRSACGRGQHHGRDLLAGDHDRRDVGAQVGLVAGGGDAHAVGAGAVRDQRGRRVGGAGREAGGRRRDGGQVGGRVGDVHVEPAGIKRGFVDADLCAAAGRGCEVLVQDRRSDRATRLVRQQRVIDRKSVV